MKLLPFTLIIAGTSKQHKRMLEGFWSKYKATDDIVCVCSIRGFAWILISLYYEPLPWFMIKGVASIFCKGVRNSEDSCSADTNSPIGHHIAIMRAIQYIIHITL